MPMIGRREERGYLVLEITGMINGQIYGAFNERSFLDTFREYASNAGKPFAIDVTGCRLIGSGPIGLFLEAYRIKKEKIPVISNNDRRLAELLRRTHIDFVELYESADTLPELQPTSSQ